MRGAATCSSGRTCARGRGRAAPPAWSPTPTRARSRPAGRCGSMATTTRSWSAADVPHPCHGVPRPGAGGRALALPRVRPRPRVRARELQARLPDQPARPARDPPAADRGRVHVRARPGLGADRRVPLPGLLHPDRDRVPAAGAPDHARHRDRPRPAARAPGCRRARDPRGEAGGAMNTIDVDVGGTFTALVLTLDGTTSYRKVPTTPYDLSVGFMQVVEEAADEAGLSLDELVGQIETVRYSTTVAMNRLLERSGPRVALITTQGHEDATLIGKGAQWIDGTRIDERRALPLQNKPAPIVPRELIAGVKERIDARGEVVRPLDEDHVREQVRRLVE